MYTLRLILLALGGLFTLAACFMVIGVTWTIYEEGETPTGDDLLGILLVEAMLVSLTVGFFYLARLIARKQTALELAAQASYVPVELPCPQCDSLRMFQGPEEMSWRFRMSYTARCLDCGHRFSVPFETWRWLPLPESGDAYETRRDKQHLMRRIQMTMGQTVFVLLGLIGFMVTCFLLGGFNDADGAFEAYRRPQFALLPLVLYGLWWLGRRLFPPKRTGDEYCARCGYDVHGCAETHCPHCSTPFQRAD